MRPLDDLWKQKMDAADVQLYLMPRQSSSAGKRAVDDPPGELSNNQKKKAKKAAALAAKGGSAPKGKGKGQGKEKGKVSMSPSMPAALFGGVAAMPDGSRLCFGYNLGTCPSSGAKCQKGLHKCCKNQCFIADHIFIECPN